MSATISAPAHIQNILSRLREVKQTGSGKWRACCPAHNDRHPSLDITIGQDEKALLFCRSGGCSYAEVMQAIGLTPQDGFPPRENRGERAQPNARVIHPPPKVTQYQIVDATGALMGVHCRRDYLDASGKPYRNKDVVGTTPESQVG